MPEQRPRPSRESLSPDDLRLVRRIEELYGPTRWKWDGWSGAPEALPTTSSHRPMRKRAPSSSLVLRTLVLSVLGLFLLYVAVGDRDALGQALMEPLRAAGIVQPTSAPPSTAEYLLALQTLRIGEVPPPSDATVRQLKDVLDQMALKCNEDRFSLARAVLAARDAFAARGVEASALSILTQANATVPDQTRQQWPTNCTDIVNRVARAD